jgi:hypothetical protein
MAIPVTPTSPVKNGNRCQFLWQCTSFGNPAVVLRGVFASGGNRNRDAYHRRLFGQNSNLWETDYLGSPKTYGLP